MCTCVSYWPARRCAGRAPQVPPPFCREWCVSRPWRPFRVRVGQNAAVLGRDRSVVQQNSHFSRNAAAEGASRFSPPPRPLRRKEHCSVPRIDGAMLHYGRCVPLASCQCAASNTGETPVPPADPLPLRHSTALPADFQVKNCATRRGRVARTDRVHRTYTTRTAHPPISGVLPDCPHRRKRRRWGTRLVAVACGESPLRYTYRHGEARSA